MSTRACSAHDQAGPSGLLLIQLNLTPDIYLISCHLFFLKSLLKGSILTTVPIYVLGTTGLFPFNTGNSRTEGEWHEQCWLCPQAV